MIMSSDQVNKFCKFHVWFFSGQITYSSYITLVCTCVHNCTLAEVIKQSQTESMYRQWLTQDDNSVIGINKHCKYYVLKYMTACENCLLV